MLSSKTHDDWLPEDVRLAIGTHFKYCSVNNERLMGTINCVSEALPHMYRGRYS